MNFPFFHSPEKNPEDKTIERAPASIEHYGHNITEGGEFLDDALRMKEQPLMYTEESIAAGSPKDLW